MEKYKIKVNNEAESKEVQELFFELGYYWSTGLDVKNLDARFFICKGSYNHNGLLFYRFQQC